MSTKTPKKINATSQSPKEKKINAGFTRKQSNRNVKKKYAVQSSNNKFNLTRKEIAILASLAKGSSYKMIAKDCDISINTVRGHMRHIYRKLNIHSMMEALLMVMKEKLL